MRHMFTRWVPQQLWEAAAAWLEKHRAKNNLFDADVLDYPQTRIIEAYQYNEKRETRPAVVMPIQKVLMMESIGPRPGLEPRDEALALKAITQALVHTADTEGIGEIYFLCDDPDVVKFAQAHGYVKREIACLQFKI